MSVSLLLALLEAHVNDEPDYSGEYQRQASVDPNIRSRMLAQLYNVLQSTFVMGKEESNALGTVLAGTLSDGQGEGLADAKLRLRATLRHEMVKHFNALREQYPSGLRSSYSRTSPGGHSSPSVGEELHLLLDTILQRLGIR